MVTAILCKVVFRLQATRGAKPGGALGNPGLRTLYPGRQGRRRAGQDVAGFWPGRIPSVSASGSPRPASFPCLEPLGPTAGLQALVNEHPMVPRWCPTGTCTCPKMFINLRACRLRQQRLTSFVLHSAPVTSTWITLCLLLPWILILLACLLYTAPCTYACTLILRACPPLNLQPLLPRHQQAKVDPCARANPTAKAYPSY